jgi:hypothetical protein
MALRLEPADEGLHPLGPEVNFNESMYFNVVDPRSGLGGFFRLGNRPNEGTGEMTCCIWLPPASGTVRDGAQRQVAFMFQRPEITDNDSFEAAGMRFGVIEPFEHLEVTYEGKVVLLDDPLALADPRAAFREHPWCECKVELSYTRAGPMVGGEPTTPQERPGEEFARGHYEQLVAAKGVIRVGHQEWPVDGFGLRDHSWGPRYWQAPWYYRWLTANAGADFGFMGSRIARRPGEGDGIRAGFVWEDGTLHHCDGFELTTEWTGDASYHTAIDATLRSGERSWHIRGRVLSLVPLRNRRRTPEGDDLVTRIGEGLTEWTVDGERIGYGLSEYLDQIVDGSPVGLSE